MAKVIDVKNNQVIVTDLETGKCVMQPYVFKIKALYVAFSYTKVGKDLGMMAFKKLHKKEDIVNFYDAAGDELGCSLSKFANLLNGACYRAYIKPNEPWHNRFGLVYSKNIKGHVTVSRDHITVKAVNARIDILNMYVADNMRHMAGFGLLFGEAHQAKKSMGKGLWKNLCKNSLSRNDMICKKLLSYPKNVLAHKAVKDLVHFLNELPSTILNKFGAEHLLDYFKTGYTTKVTNLFNKIIKHIGGPLCKIEPAKANTIRVMIGDSLRLNRTTFNPSWSIARMIREHDEGTKRLRLKATSPEEFGAVKVLPNVISNDQFQAIICKSAKDMVELGNEQHHCVGSYSMYARHGHYAVYKIVSNTGEVTTLGISNPESPLGLPNQHYGAFNAQVLDEQRKAFANKVKNKIINIMKERMLPNSPDVCENTHVIVVPADGIPF